MKKFLVIVMALWIGLSGASTALAGASTFQVSSLANTVNEDGTNYFVNASTIWIGNSSSKTLSFTGMRFTNVTIPSGATVTSAKIRLYSSQNQWISISISMAGELSANSAAFSSSSKPSQRTLTTNKVTHKSNVSWTANTWYSLDEMAPVVQEIINQAAWTSGNSLTIIFKGTGSSWGKKNVAAWSSTAQNAPQLLITYSGGSSTATATAIPATPTATTVPPTFTATVPPVPTAINPTATLVPATVTPLPPTATLVPPTATVVPPTATPTSILPTATPGAANSTIFAIGPAWSDDIPHQLVRTADDRVYFFGTGGEDSPILHAYWTAKAGLPNVTADFSGSAVVNNGSNIFSSAVAYNGASTIHVLTNGLDGKMIDRIFDTVTNTFKPAKVLDSSGATLVGYYLGTSGITAMIDQNQVLHIAYWTNGNHVVYRAYTYSAAQDVLTLVDGPTQMDASGNANHPVLAVSPLDGSVTLAWMSQAQVVAKTKNAGTWGSLEIVNAAEAWTSTSSGINIDQGPSLVIGNDGTKHLSYIENWRGSTPPNDYGRVHYVVNKGSGWVDQYIGSYSHDPAVAVDSTGQVTILGHGYPLNAACTSLDDVCSYKRNADGSWATPKLILAHQGTQTFDASPSVKWSAVGNNRPELTEFVIAEVGAGYNNPVIYYGRLGTN